MSNYEVMNGSHPVAVPEADMLMYALMLNLDDATPARPYYVGSTSNLVGELRKSRYVVWHNQEFNRPPLVLVLGLVRRDVAQTAAADLQFQLLAEGYLLAGVGVPEAQDVRRTRRYELFQYARREHDGRLLPLWRQKWLGGEVAAKPVVEHHGVSKHDLVKYMAYDPAADEGVQALLVRLAEAYDGRKHEARLVLTEAELRLLEDEAVLPVFEGYWRRIVATVDGSTVFTLADGFAARVRVNAPTLGTA